MELSRQYSLQSYGLLYPLMVIVAIAFIVFSLVGIATVSGWMPSAMAAAPVAATSPQEGVAQNGGAAFQCAACGVIQSVREIERDVRS